MIPEIKKFAALLFFILLTPVLACAGAFIQQNPDIEKIEIRSNNEMIAAFTVEKVSGIREVQQGLSGRSSLPRNHGMLFILDSTAEHSFWMKGMEFPIDILFFDRNRILLEILHNLQPCTECPSYKTPPGTAYALEISAGAAGDLGIKTGYNFIFTGNLPR
jgi:uncharacterized membrane protein (UPF0127 family)